VLDVKAKEIMKFIQTPPPIVCSETEDWVEVVGNVARITAEAKKLHGHIECNFYGSQILLIENVNIHKTINNKTVKKVKVMNFNLA